MRKLLFITTICLLCFSCKKERFSTDSNWLAPVLKSNLTIADLLPDSLSQSNLDNSVNLSYTYKYGINNLEDFFEVPDRVETIEVSLESLVLDDRAFSDTFTLAELYPLSIVFDGTYQSIPAQDVTTDEGTIIDVTEEFFTTATFIEGWIDIEMFNELPVTAELIEFELRNESDQSLILEGSFSNLMPNTGDSNSYSLAGKTVNGVMEMRVKKVKTSASNGDVLIDAYKGLQTTFSVRGLKPETATAIFPAQNLIERRDETEYTFGGAQLTRIIIDEGDILMKVESTIEEEIILDYRIPFSSKDYKAIRKIWRIPPAPPGQTIYVEERFPIDSFDIVLAGNDLNAEPYTNHIYNELIASIEYTGIERTLSLSDKINIEFGLVDITPLVVIGDPGEHSFSLKDTFDIPLFKNTGGSISLEDASFNMNIENSFGIEAKIDASNVVGINSRKPKNVALISDELMEPFFIGKAVNNFGDVTPAEKSISMDKSNSNLKTFLENLPDQIQPNLDVVIRPNPTFELGDFAFNFSELNADFTIDVPMTIGFDSFTLSKTEEANLFENKVLDGLKALKINAKVQNSFPISGSATLEVLDLNGNVLTVLAAEDNGTIEAAELNPVSGKTEFPMDSELIFNADRDEFALIKSGYQFKIVAKFDTENAARVKLYNDYYIDVKLIADFIYDY